MTYELAKELKDAGFPGIISEKGHIHSHPTLEELIGACGKYICLVEDAEGWWALHNEKPFESPVGLDAIDTFMVVRVHGKTPLEAVARLWLALKK